MGVRVCMCKNEFLSYKAVGDRGKNSVVQRGKGMENCYFIRVCEAYEVRMKCSGIRETRSKEG